MKDKLNNIKKQALEEIGQVASVLELEKIEKKYLGRQKGELTQILRGLKDLSVEEKREIGGLANQIKRIIEENISQRKKILESKIGLGQENMDLTYPVEREKLGHCHPNSIVQYELEDIFRSLGFMVLDGPELESEFFNFEALNIQADHPARDMQDTFFVDTGEKQNPQNRFLLRTHTSAMQVRALRQYGAPFRGVFPGRCFRYEATDASHETTFYQLEGLMVDKNISVANLIAVMKTLLKGIFKREVEIRLRPGYFPFVEPGFELDIKCSICAGRGRLSASHGCSVCKNSGWLELLPCGMVHPNVLKYGGIDPKKYSGFAFGLGLTRLVMMKYGIDDIRLLNSGDLRFLKQF